MPVDLDVDRRIDGTILIRSRVPLPAHDANFARAFATRAVAQGDAVALAWRDAHDEWVRLSYRDLKGQVDAAASWLIANLPPASTVMILADNGRAAAVMTLAAITAGMVAAPVGCGYALVGEPFGRLRHVLALERPRAALLGSAPAFAAVAAFLRDAGVMTIAEDSPAFDADLSLADIVATSRRGDLDRIIDELDVDAPAQVMLTSGSTGLPKAVPLTPRMMMASASQGVASIGESAGWSRALVEWMPWTHAAGAGVLRACLLMGGAFHIDAGKPLPGMFDQTVRNLREVPVAFYTSAPIGYAMLADALERDEQLRRTFFSELTLMIYGGAALPQPVADRLQALALAEVGRPIPIITGYGMTETTTGVMTIHWPETQVGLGLPMPATIVKLLPNGERFEIRLKGPTIMAGYVGDPALTTSVFDEEGFYCTGDLAQFQDPADIGRGLRFAGRQAEEFKLANGNWVPGGMLREALLKSLSGTIRELVLADDGRPFLALLAWAVPGDGIDAVAAAVAQANRHAAGATAHIARVMLLEEPPSAAHGELSEKGTVNRRAVLDRRSDLVARLFADADDPDVRRIE